MYHGAVMWVGKILSWANIYTLKGFLEPKTLEEPIKPDLPDSLKLHPPASKNQESV